MGAGIWCITRLFPPLKYGNWKETDGNKEITVPFLTQTTRCYGNGIISPQWVEHGDKPPNPRISSGYNNNNTNDN